MKYRLIQMAVLTLATVGFMLMAPAAIAQTSAGSMTGRILDATGGALPGVTVTATNTATGFSRSVVTGSDGGYIFPSLPVGTYNVTAELAGFATVTARSVEVQVATERKLDLTLKQAAVREQITVTAEAPLVSTTPSIGTVVTEREIQNLPLNGRQFANLGTLAPGTNLMVNSDPTKPDQLVIAVNGGSGRNMNYLIDGGDNTDDTIGGALQNFNLDAVQEFKVQTQQYKAEFGRSTGGVLTVVTKGGTNRLEGSVFGYFRNKSLNSITESEKIAGIPKQDYRRDQYGFSLGGPIVKDRAHYFGTWEHTKKNTSYTVDSGGSFPEFDGKSYPLPLKNDLITAKSTVDLTSKQYLQVRYGYQKITEKYGESPLVAPDSLSTLTNKYQSILGGHNFQIGANKLNEFLYQWSKFDNVILPDSNSPTIYFASGGIRGQNFNSPQDTHQKKSQFKDDFSWSSNLLGGRHDLKAGVNYINEPILGGGFSTGTVGQYTLLTDNINGPVGEITFFTGNLGQQTPIKEYNGYLQDDWSVNPKLTVDLGVRYDLWTGYDLDQSANPIWRYLTTQTKYNEYYLRDFQGSSGLKNARKNWSPRLGFSYDIHGNGSGIVRAGYGRYYQMPYTNATILFPASAVQSTYGVSYDLVAADAMGIRNADGSIFHVGQPLPAGGEAAGIPPNEVASPTLAAPYSDQSSLGYSWQVNPWLGLSTEAVHIDYRDLPFRFRGNPKDPATGKRRFPFGNFRIWYGKGRARYNGANLGAHARVGERLLLQGFYTYSKSTGNVLAGADEFRLTAADWQPDLKGSGVKDVSVNPLDPLCGACFGPLATDARHRVTLSAVYRAPFGINLSSLLRYHSATPFMDWTGVDTNGDGFKLELPPGVSHVNALRGHSFSQWDGRVGKEFLFAGGVGLEVMVEGFNLLNEKNPTGYRGARSNPATYHTPSRYAGDPNQGEQRLFQLGARVHF
jgi:carboxypeptidase family protein/TonB-dependent receptor-like protein